MSAGGTERLSEEQAKEAWQRVHDFVEPLMRRGSEEVMWNVAPGSELARDDSRSDPFQTSHAVARAFGAAVDHLHAVTMLLFEAKVMHPYAPFNIVRAALENAATGLWLVHPDQRRVRLQRTFFLARQDIEDEARALQSLDVEVPGQQSKHVKVARLREVAAAAGLKDPMRERPPRATSVLKYADDHPKYEGALGPLFAWQVCSGFAHGRAWAPLAILEAQRMDSQEEGIAYLRQTSSLDRILYPAWAACEVLGQAIDVFHIRASPQETQYST